MPVLRSTIASLLAVITVVIAIGALPASRASAKLVSANLWLVGGDLPHPVELPTEELLNPEARQGEAYSLYTTPPSGPLGPGYDVLSGADLATALNSVQNPSVECCQTFYPTGPGAGVIENWRSLAPTDTGQAGDRQDVSWESASGGLYALITRYIALAKAGLIGSTPTGAAGARASVQLFGVQASITPTLGGAETTIVDRDAMSLAIALSSLPLNEVHLPVTLPGDRIWRLSVRYPDGAGTYGWQYFYAPPGVLARDGLLLPQLGTVLASSNWSAPAQAYATTPVVDRLLAPYLA